MTEEFSRPKKVYLELTRACNLACIHCLNDSGSRMEAEFRSEEVLELVGRLTAFGVLEIRFTGGEPTIHPVFEEAIALATRLGVKTSIGSNAVAITEESAARLFQAGLQKAIVSLDGDEPRNDAVRGAGSFRRSWRGVCALHASGVDVRVNAVAMKTTMGGLRSLAEICVEEGVHLFIRRYIPSGRAVGNLSEFPTNVDYAHLRTELHAFVQQGAVDGHYLSANRHEVCSAGTSAFVILPNGDVKSCGFLSELGESSYGNVRSEELSVIWNRVTSSRFLAESNSSLESWSNRRPDLPRTNCPAIAIGGGEALVQLRRRSS